jgi:uncharacterized membrane protein
MVGRMETIFPGLAAAPNIHPALVHFPIALWLVAIVLYIVGLARGQKQLWTNGAWLLLLATIAGALTAVSGYAAADQLGHDSPAHDLVHTHRNWMLAALGCAIASTALALRELKSPNQTLRFAVAACMVVTAATVTLGADRGALLVYGHGMGVAEEPPATEGHSQHGHSDHGHSVHGHSDHAEPAAAEPEAAETEAAETEAAETEAADPAPADPAPAPKGHEGHDHGH